MKLSAAQLRNSETGRKKGRSKCCGLLAVYENQFLR